MQPPLVMVIDDSPTVRKIVEVTLKRTGYRVRSFVDGVEAIKWLLAPDQHEVPALLFLDIHLPKMNGYQVARYLKGREQFAGISIVMLTRCNGLVDLFKAKLYGVVDYITKPFTTDEIIEVARKFAGAPVAIEPILSNS